MVLIRENGIQQINSMAQQRGKRTFSVLLILVLTLMFCRPAIAYDNPDLLPDHPTAVIDLAKVLTDQQRAKLEESLYDYEEESGWKLRVLTQYEKTPGIAVRKYWNLDERSVLLIADPRGGNLLNFNVGDALFALLPRLFWVELQTRFGNQYYVRDNGEDRAVINAIDSIETCLDRGGCKVVPGLPREQWIWTLMTSILGGLIAGIAAFPRKRDVIIAWPWLLLLSPLWVMLFGIFGIAPIITRTTDIFPLIVNSTAFISSALASYLIAKETIGKQIGEEI